MQAADTMPTWHFALWFPVFFIALWSFVCIAIALIGGWWKLARTYRARTKFTGRWVSSYLGCSMRYGTSYSGFVLKLGESLDGLHLSIFPLFRIGHAPLQIPWDEISVEKSPWWYWYQNVTLRLGKDSLIPLRMSKRFASKLPQIRVRLLPIFPEDAVLSRDQD